MYEGNYEKQEKTMNKESQYQAGLIQTYIFAKQRSGGVMRKISFQVEKSSIHEKHRDMTSSSWQRAFCVPRFDKINCQCMLHLKSPPFHLHPGLKP